MSYLITCEKERKDERSIEEFKERMIAANLGSIETILSLFDEAEGAKGLQPPRRDLMPGSDPLSDEEVAFIQWLLPQEGEVELP